MGSGSHCLAALPELKEPLRVKTPPALVCGTSPRWVYLLPILGIGILQAILVSIAFPITELLTERPILHIDAAYHWYQMAMARAFAESGVLVGYDPYFAAGNIAGVIPRMSTKLALGLAIVAPDVSISVLYKWYVFVGAVLAPSLVALSCRILGFRIREMTIASILSLLLWWTSQLRWYHTAGMSSWVFQAYLGLLFFALVVAYLRAGGRWTLLLAGVVGGLGLLLHPLFPVTVSFPVAAYVALQFREWPRWHGRWLGMVIVIPIISVLINLWWIMPSLSFGILEVNALGNEPGFMTKVDFGRVWQYLIPTWHGTSKMFPFLALLGFVGCITVQRWESRTVLWALVGTWVAMSLFAWLGAGVPAIGRYTQPNRFASVGYLALSVPAAFGVTAMVRLLLRPGSRLRRVAVGAVAIVLAFVAAYSTYELGREIPSADVGRRGKRPPEVSGDGEYTHWLRQWISTNTSPSARVMLETSKGRKFDNSHLAGYLALQEDREIIGGPYLGKRFADAWDGWAFGGPLEEMSPDRFLAYIDLYNIGWIVAHSESLKRYLDNMESVTPEAHFQFVQTYRVQREHSYFSEGQGRIAERAHNRLVLDGLEGEYVVLRYHYFPRLESTPPITIESVYYLDDPDPFIKLNRPPPRLELRVR